MNRFRLILGSFLFTLLLWGFVSWPLPRYTNSGIATAAYTSEENCVRTMMPGDHLQFLYHLWLGKDTFFGPTPLFHNLYEFNTGDDDDRYDPANRYYLPFSLIFSFFSLFGSQAFAWNMMNIVVLWLTLIPTWLIAKRFTDNSATAITASLISIVFPYRWFTLMSGSPTNLAMMWVPIIYLGLLVVVLDRKAWGAILAGVALCLSTWCDEHTTFFGALSAPFWCLFLWLYFKSKIIPSKDDTKKILKAGWPLAIFFVILVLQAVATQKNMIDTVISKAHRPFGVIASNSPHIAGIYSTQPTGIDSQIYIGWFLVVLISSALLATIVHSFRNPDNMPKQRLLAVILLFLAVGATVLLATGMNVPGGEKSWGFLIRVLPPYGKIRQPAKIFIIMPALLSILAVVTLPSLLAFIRSQRWQKVACLLFCHLLVADYCARIHPSICVIEKAQAAYEAVLNDANDRNIKPHIIALPLWPGDSHWTSINQYYISLYRIRMVNGYRPTTRNTYLNDIYFPFESFNQGALSDKQLDNLMKRGVNYIVLHEDAYPEKVSPFPVAHLLQRLLLHPRIELLAQDGAVWSFKLSVEDTGIYPSPPDWNLRCPARLWQAEKCASTNTSVMQSDDTSENRYLRLAGNDSWAETDTYTMPSLPGLCYFVRLKGKGEVTASIYSDDEELASKQIIVDEGSWEWHTVTVPAFEGYKATRVRIKTEEGTIDIDLSILSTTHWNPREMNEAITIPAPVFFHGGYTDLQRNEVVLRPDRDPANAVFYGPKLPVPAGTYNIQILFESDAPAGTVLGTMRSRYPHGIAEPVEVTAGKPAILNYRQDVNLRLAVNFVYARSATVRIKNIIITPVNNGQKEVDN